MTTRIAASRTARFIILLAVLIPIFYTTYVFATAIGDQVELQARNRAGVPLHQEPRGTHDFQRVPDGTIATVSEVVQDGRWLKLTLPDGRTGWVTSSYVSPIGNTPSTGTSPAGKKPHRIEKALSSALLTATR